MWRLGSRQSILKTRIVLGTVKPFLRQKGSGPRDPTHYIRFACIYGLKSGQTCPIQTILWPLQNHIYHLEGLAFRNSFWYAAKNSNSYSDYTLIGTLYSTHKKTHHKQKLFFPELCEVKVSGLCANYIFMKFTMWVKLAKAHFSSLRSYILRNALYEMIFVIVLKSPSRQNSCNGKE